MISMSPNTQDIIGILRKMIKTIRLASDQNSAINYLRIVADHEDACQKTAGVAFVELLLWYLKARDVDNRALSDVLEKIVRHES